MELLTCVGYDYKPLDIQEPIQKHNKVSQELLIELPPNREIKHTIEIKPSEKPMNIKPYRYPTHHKTKIEILTQDLLKCGVISKRRSPYAAPIVLVRKDGSFRLCIDQCYKYRVGEYIAKGSKRNYRIYRQKCRQTSAK